jgi:hypothetical protein
VIAYHLLWRDDVHGSWIRGGGTFVENEHAPRRTSQAPRISPMITGFPLWPRDDPTATRVGQRASAETANAPPDGRRVTNRTSSVT